MIRAWILPSNKDSVRELEVLEGDGSLADADHFLQRQPRRFVTHVRTIWAGAEGSEKPLRYWCGPRYRRLPDQDCSTRSIRPRSWRTHLPTKSVRSGRRR